MPASVKIEHEVLGGGNEQLLDEILLFRLHPGLTLAAAALGAIQGNGATLDVAGMGDGHHHVLFDDGVLQSDFGGLPDDFSPACIAELLLYLKELSLDDLEDLRLRTENLFKAGDDTENFLVFLDDLVPLQSRSSDGASFRG